MAEPGLDIEAPLLELCMVWQPSHSAAPPEWNANATPLNEKVMSQASIRIRFILNFILICPSHFASALRQPGSTLRHVALFSPVRIG
jgi:hypothetical protein